MLVITKTTFLLFLGHLLAVGEAGNVPLPLGIVFEQGMPEVQTAFKHGLITFTLNITTNPNDVYRFTAFVDIINTADAFKLSKLRIYAMVGSMNGESFHTFHAFANTFHMPFITPWYPSKDLLPSGSVDYATRLQPDFNPAILATIAHYGWKDLIYLYSSNEGLLRLQSLFHRSQPSDSTSIRLKMVKKVTSAKDAISLLKEIESLERYSPKYILLDTPTSLAKEIVIAHVQDVGLGRRTYHYFLAGLSFDDPWEPSVPEYVAVNITGFRMVDPSRPYVQDFLRKWASLNAYENNGVPEGIAANAAFISDGMLVLHQAFTELLNDNPYAFSGTDQRSLCETPSSNESRPFEHGLGINQRIRLVQTEGLTGNLQFHENGTRKFFTVDVMELRGNATKVKIASWSDYGGFKALGQQGTKKKLNKKVYTLGSVLEEPFLMRKGQYFEGYVKDLADKLFSNLGLEYRIQISKDGKVGAKVGESWNGLVGELTRKEIDLVLAPLPITPERERVLDFSQPFFHQGIGILAYRPQGNGISQPANMFSFLSPFSCWAWLSVGLAYLGASGAFYLIHRLTSAHNLQVISLQNGDVASNSKSSHIYLVQKRRRKELEGNPSISYFLWLSFSVLTSSSRSSPSVVGRSLAGRLALTIWWLFALFFVCLYVGNYITISMNGWNERVGGRTSIRSAWDLIDRQRSKIEYGMLTSGATQDVFEKSENEVYRVMYDHMSRSKGWNMASFEEGISAVRQRKGKYVLIMESSKIEYASSRQPCNTMQVGVDLAEVQYGIAFPQGSPLKEVLDAELLRLRDNSSWLQELRRKWFSKSECDLTDVRSKIPDVSTLSLSLGNLAGIFYILIGSLVLALGVSFVEYFCCGKGRGPSHPSGEKKKAEKAEAAMGNNKAPASDVAGGTVLQESFHQTTLQRNHHHHQHHNQQQQLVHRQQLHHQHQQLLEHQHCHVLSPASSTTSSSSHLHHAHHHHHSHLQHSHHHHQLSPVPPQMTQLAMGQDLPPSSSSPIPIQGAIPVPNDFCDVDISQNN